ncbi:hypothetical protein GCM10027425_32130 [Alteromonas gracilis]
MTSTGRYSILPSTGPRPADLVLGGRPMPLTGTLRVWTCGITPYDVTHLGHAATFVWTDLLVSVAAKLGVRTVSSRNVTDVDDVLTAAAGARQRQPEEYAVTQEFLFDRDMRDLAIDRPDSNPRARTHVPQMIQFVEALLAVGAAYEVDGSVLFRAPADLAKPDHAAEMLAEFGDADVPGREGEWDVAVWKASGESDPAWPSPWGWGRPGWHVECAAMAATVFGSTVDVLAGGADLAFPHHAYQAAMARAVSGVEFARRDLHVGTVFADGSKMAKSTGNLVLVRDLLERVPGPVIRLLLLNRPWGHAWEYAEDQLAEAERTLEALHSASGRPGDGEAQVLAALVDDLDVPRALEIALETGGRGARLLADVLKV